jgi:hypothetical protein
MTGDSYIAYSSSLNSNEYAYSWAATELNLTITGDYVAPPYPTN